MIAFLAALTLFPAQDTDRILPLPPLPEAELRALVEATFDPNGPYDDGPKLDSPAEPPLAEDPGLQQSFFSAAPSNDNCSNATVIPGNAVSYSPFPYSTATATNEACDGSESCGGIGTSRSVWYTYTPARDGRMNIDTIGSNFNTVLSVFGRCGFQSGLFCVLPNELACNNDYQFGTTSYITMEVDAGSTYLIKCASAFGASGGTLDFDFRFQPGNDSCPDATEIVGVAFTDEFLPIDNATTDVCEPNEDCEFNGAGVSNSVWYRYIAPCDGTLDLNTNGSNYDTVLSIWDGCSSGSLNCTYPNQIACDDDSGTGNDSQLVGVPVQAGEEVLIKVASWMATPSTGQLQFAFLFTPANQPLAQIVAPSSFSYGCGLVSVVGTAEAAGGGYTSWTLDYRSTGGGGWTELASSTTPVVSGLLASWNTTALSSGSYLLRLTVSNVCGTTESDVSVVYVDHAFDSVVLRAPGASTTLAGLICLDGTAWDLFFDSYTLDYMRSGVPGWTPVGAHEYTTPVTNDPLAQGAWDTLAAGVSDGSYVLRLRGTDLCGNSAEATVGFLLDNTPPVAEFHEPGPGNWVTGSVAIVGTANDANLSSWSLQVAGGRGDSWKTLATGTAPVVNGVLGVWDTAEEKIGGYVLRLVVVGDALVNCDDPARTETLRGLNVGRSRSLLR